MCIDSKSQDYIYLYFFLQDVYNILTEKTMKSTKNLFLISALVCVLSCLINIIYAIDAFSQNKIFVGIIYIIMSIVGMVCVVAFVFYSKQNNEYLLTHLKQIKIYSIISIFCTMLGGLVAIYAYYTLLIINREMPHYQNYQSKNISGVEIIDDKRMAKYIDDLNRLEELKKNDIIDIVEYERLKKQIINQYLNKGE